MILGHLLFFYHSLLCLGFSLYHPSISSPASFQNNHMHVVFNRLNFRCFTCVLIAYREPFECLLIVTHYSVRLFLLIYSFLIVHMTVRYSLLSLSRSLLSWWNGFTEIMLNDPQLLYFVYVIFPLNIIYCKIPST